MHIGVALSVLFIGRLAYNFITKSHAAAPPDPSIPFKSPLTLFILGLTIGYYIVYQIGVLVHNHDKK